MRLTHLRLVQDKGDKLFLSLVNTLSGQAVQETYEVTYFHASAEWYWNIISKTV